jgi:hypothetical protein
MGFGLVCHWVGRISILMRDYSPLKDGLSIMNDRQKTIVMVAMTFNLLFNGGSAGTVVMKRVS